MKLLTLFIALLLISCGRETAVINGETPYVVNTIRPSASKKGMCRYICHDSEASVITASPFATWPAIVAPCGLYNIGDTITLGR